MLHRTEKNIDDIKFIINNLRKEDKEEVNETVEG